MLTEEDLQAIRQTEWFVYVINNPRGTGRRFIVTDGLSPFHDEQVKNLLTKDEFIDEVNTLDGRLNGRSEVLNVNDDSLSRLRTERDELKRRLRDRIEQQEKAMVDDGPTSACAAHHRGAIAAYKLILSELLRGVQGEGEGRN